MTSRADGRAGLGRAGERYAAQHLAAQGMVVLDRNWRCGRGELDLVALDGRVVVAVEVKTRRSARVGAPLEAVDATRLARLHDLAWEWLTTHDVRSDGVRVDLVGILWPAGRRPEVEHVRGVA